MLINLIKFAAPFWGTVVAYKAWEAYRQEGSATQPRAQGDAEAAAAAPAPSPAPQGTPGRSSGAV